MSKRFELINFLNAHDNFKDNKNDKKLDSFDVVELLNHYDKLQTLLAEKEKAVEYLQEINQSLGQTCNNDAKEIERLRGLISEKDNKINFYKSYYVSFREKVIDELEKVKAELVKLGQDYSLNLCGIKIYNFVDDQINELKGKVEDERN